jgi:putative transposase
MYEWRKLTTEQQEELLQFRRKTARPWHNPPRLDLQEGFCLLSAACHEHKSYIGSGPHRMSEFASRLLQMLAEHTTEVYARCVLPNHYHSLFRTENIKEIRKGVGQFHGRTSHAWNGEDLTRGRKVWYNHTERSMRSERHFWVTMNYIHHNPVHHRYCRKWQEWPFSSASVFLEEVGRHEAMRLWGAYPIRDYGKGWDDPDM